MRRTPSPAGDSTFTTSAPKSARWRAAPGPANTVAMSRTRNPANACIDRQARRGVLHLLDSEALDHALERVREPKLVRRVGEEAQQRVVAGRERHVQPRVLTGAEARDPTDIRDRRE